MSRRKMGSVQPDWLADRTYRGTGFNDMPANPRHGQMHFPAHGPSGGEDPEWAYYDEAKDKWLSISRYTFQALGTTQSATNPLWIDYASSSLIQYSSSVGHPCPYDFELMSLSLRAIVASTVTVQMYVNGVAHASSTVSLSAGTSVTADAFTSATIAKGNIVGFWVTSGTLVGGGVLTASFARVFDA